MAEVIPKHFRGISTKPWLQLPLGIDAEYGSRFYLNRTESSKGSYLNYMITRHTRQTAQLESRPSDLEAWGLLFLLGNFELVAEESGNFELVLSKNFYLGMKKSLIIFPLLLVLWAQLSHF